MLLCSIFYILSKKKQIEHKIWYLGLWKFPQKLFEFKSSSSLQNRKINTLKEIVFYHTCSIIALFVCLSSRYKLVYYIVWKARILGWLFLLFFFFCYSYESINVIVIDSKIKETKKNTESLIQSKMYLSQGKK